MRRKRHLAILIITLVLLVADRVLKDLALRAFADRTLFLISDEVIFRLFRNHGIAFSLPFSGPAVWILTIGLLVAAAVLAGKALQRGRKDLAAAYGMFAAGAASNLFDRMAHGFTVDYLIFFSRSAVNLADGMIVLGAVLLLLWQPKRQA